MHRRDTTAASVAESPPAVAPHLREAELATRRLDAYFWIAVRAIIQDESGERYAYTAGERKAIQRLLAKQEVPIGVILAALRAVMTLPARARPQTLATLLSLPVFHACVDAAAALVPRPGAPLTMAGTWEAFMQAYRSVGLTDSLRTVSPIEWPLIQELFERHPTECWEVLRRVEHMAMPPQLTYEYLKRAVINNQRAAAIQALQPGARTAVCAGADRGDVSAQPRGEAHGQPPHDPRRALLEREGVNPNILTPAMTLDLIQAWIEEADVRSASITHRAGWLAWGLKQETFPQDVPEVGRRPGRPANPRSQRPEREGGRAVHAALQDDAEPAPASQLIWRAVLDQLAAQIPAIEFQTWIEESVLLDMADDEVIVGVPNVFARDVLETTYLAAIAGELQRVVGTSMQVRVVIARRS